MSDYELTEQTHPPILLSARLLDRVVLRVGLALISWAQASANRRQAPRFTSPERVLDQVELEGRLEQAQLERTKLLLQLHRCL
jgi:hypothetical protein